MASPLPNTNAPASAKQDACARTDAGASCTPVRITARGRARAPRLRSIGRRRPARRRRRARTARRAPTPSTQCERAHEKQRPQQPVAAERSLHELVDAPRDDRDDGRADPVERTLHPRQAAVREVERREDEDHDERRQHERDRDERGAEHAMVEPPEVDRELCRERPGRELRQGEALLVVLQRDPSPPLDEVALHVADERDRAAESGRPEVQEVDAEIAQQ